jgi:hypothetical protein
VADKDQRRAIYVLPVLSHVAPQAFLTFSQ